MIGLRDGKEKEDTTVQINLVWGARTKEEVSRRDFANKIQFGRQ